MSLKLVLFESLGAVSYSPSIVTVAVSVAICEIFSVEELCDLKTGLGFVQGHWKLHRLLDCIAFHCNYGDILYRLRDITSYWFKIGKFLYPTFYDSLRNQCMYVCI